MTDDRTPDEWRPLILEALLRHVPFDGWSENALDLALTELGISRGLVRLAYPDGMTEIIEAWAAGVDDELAVRAAAVDLAAMKIRARITWLVRTRLELVAVHQNAEQKALAHMGLPHNAPRAAALLYRITDRIWRLAGDTSFDFNFYTKRATLAAVYSSTLLFLLADDSDNYADSWAFLDRRIADVMRIETAKAAFKGKLPDPQALFARVAAFAGRANEAAE